MSICDAHVHIGHYFEGRFFDPIEVASELISVGVSRWAVSSTTICDGVSRFEETLAELDKMEMASPGRVVQILWLTPEMLASPERFLRPRFRALKIHELAHSWSDIELEGAFNLAENYSMPLIVHTGGSVRSDAGAYRELCRSHQNATIVLAHGRPVEQLPDILIESPNTFVDTAFMPVENLVSLVDAGFGSRILWGSDYPLDQIYYPKDDTVQRLNIKISEFKKVVPEQISSQFFEHNFIDVFDKRIHAEHSLI